LLRLARSLLSLIRTISFIERNCRTHITFLQQHSEVGATYNARFEIKDSANTICGLWQPPRELGLADFVLGYPVAPSDLVLRREWALLDEIWDDSYAECCGTCNI